MPARAKSLRITDRYRRDMVRLRQQGQREAKRIWQKVSPENLDGTFNVGLLEMTVSTLQKEAARLSSAYLSAFIASELGEPQQPPALSVWDKTFNGNPLREGLRSAVVKAKMAIKDGQDPTQATNASRDILVSDVGLFIDTAARESLRQGMEMDDRIVGYQRAVKGTCAACSGDTQYEAFSENAPVVPLNVHPNCQCVAEPVVNAHRDRLDAKSSESRLDRTQYALTSAERDLAQRYQGFDSLTPNKFLRAGKELYEHDQKFVNGMDRLMNKAGPLGENMQVYRGIPAQALEDATGRTMSQLEGLTFRDLGFGSTTPLRDQAAKWGAPDIFAANKEKTLWDITLSKDVKALWMESATGEKWGLKELVVQRGCRYVIEKVAKREGVWHVKATLLPPK